MVDKNKRLLWKVVFVSSLLSPFVLLSFSSLPWGNNNPVGKVTHEILYPFQYAWEGTLGFFVNTWNHYVALHNTAEENTSLKRELSLLKTTLLDYEEQRHEVTRLRDLLGFTQHHEKNNIVAEVIGLPRGEPFQAMRVSKGEADDVQIGMPVVSAEGVIGRVVRTGLHYADVQLMIDNNFNIDVLLQRTRVRGVLRGSYNTQNMRLKLNRRSEIRIGDTIITSGIVGSFPKGLPVGRVVGISYESEHISQIITVEPWVDYERVEEVVILKSFDKELQKVIETVGRSWFNTTLEQTKGG